MIYLISDIHGHIRLNWLRNELNKIKITKYDYLIITGDAGICWDSKENVSVVNYYNSLPCNVLFVDGNHENFEILLNLPMENRFGGRVHKISENIYHLMRGEVYKINKINIFTFGGGFSAKILTNSSPIYVWKEELPSKEEYLNGLQNLKKCNNRVDLILTHSAPLSIVKKNDFAYYPNDNELLDYLENIKNHVEFKHWYYGHYHKDIDNKCFSCIYERIVKVGEINE